MDISWYMFFDKDGFPLAVFYTDCCDRAMYLFSKLYKKAWEKCETEDNITVKKEDEVPIAEWEWIAKQLKRPECKIELVKHKPLDIQTLIMDASMKLARDSYLENKKDKDLKSKWAVT
jgi:hypothetical protein